MVDRGKHEKHEKAEPAAAVLAVGAAVLYLPAEHHAMTRDREGDYAWVLGRKYLQTVHDGGPLRQEEAVEELDGRRPGEYLGYLARHPDPAVERKNLVFLRPRKPWPAVVTAVHEDGTVDLDVAVGNGFTLHERGIRVDLRKQAPHTCHPREAPPAAGRPMTQEG